MGKICEGGRDLEGTEPTEYCESRLLDACDSGRARAFDCECGDVRVAGRARVSGFEWDAASSGGEVAGDASVAIAVALFKQSRLEYSSLEQKTCDRQPVYSVVVKEAASG